MWQGAAVLWGFQLPGPNVVSYCLAPAQAQTQAKPKPCGSAGQIQPMGHMLLTPLFEQSFGLRVSQIQFYW